jgi:hypothetical protein
MGGKLCANPPTESARCPAATGRRQARRRRAASSIPSICGIAKSVARAVAAVIWGSFLASGYALDRRASVRGPQTMVTPAAAPARINAMTRSAS